MTKCILAVAICVLSIACVSTWMDEGHAVTPAAPSSALELGAFSVSLSVADLSASLEFYGKLGFEPVAGDPDQNWQILRNGDCVIGIFQGLFPRNILTFNPGWTQQATQLRQFTDVRTIQEHLVASGLTLTSAADASSSGPASLMLVDPDGNPILIDQHVPKPR